MMVTKMVYQGGLKMNNIVDFPTSGRRIQGVRKPEDLGRHYHKYLKAMDELDTLYKLILREGSFGMREKAYKLMEKFDG